MQLINRKITELKPYEKNPRKNDEAVKYVQNSIKEFGFKVPLVIDKNDIIVCGHTRYKAAIGLGYEEVPCIIADDLSDEQIKAFRLADNKVSEFAEWDFDLLMDEVADLIDVDVEDFGFDLAEFIVDEPAESAVEEKERSYSICYEIAFNSEEEQSKWYDFILALKKRYPDVETISERILIVTEEWLRNDRE